MSSLELEGRINGNFMKFGLDMSEIVIFIKYHGGEVCELATSTSICVGRDMKVSL